MKIGILTHHYIKNYGAFLQVYALQETLKKLYPEAIVEVINYINRKHNIINILGWYRFNKKNDRIQLYFQKIKIPKVFKEFEKKYLNISKRVYSIKDINKLKYDTIIIGSDEVWNFEDKKSYSPIKFGCGLTCKNIITYAPSTGKSDIDKLPIECYEGLKNISSFSARDDNAEKLVLKYTNKECSRVLDPTFLLEFKEYDSNFVKKIKKEKYILMYYCDNISDELKNCIINYAKINGYKIYGAGEYQKWFDLIKININPFEWVEMFKNADIIFTGTFHGTVFSIKSKKNFYTYIGNSSRLKKINSLLQELRINNRDTYSTITNKNDYLNQSIEVIKERKKYSIEYLKNNIIDK